MKLRDYTDVKSLLWCYVRHGHEQIAVHSTTYEKATDVFLRSTGLRGFTARWDSTFIQGIPGFTSVGRIVFHLYVLWQRHDYYLCDEGMYDECTCRED